MLLLCLNLSFFYLYIIRVIFHFVTLDIRCEGHLSLITYVPLGFLRKLISEIHVKEYNNKLTLVIAPMCVSEMRSYLGSVWKQLI